MTQSPEPGNVVVEQFIISVLSCGDSIFGEMCYAHMIPTGLRAVCDVERGFFFVSQLGSDSPRPQAGWTYKINAVTTPEAHWDSLPFQPRGNIMSFEVLARTNTMHSLTG